MQCDRTPACGNAPNASEVASRLPVLNGPHQDATWHSYLRRVYGELPPREAYPIDLRDFRWLYVAKIPVDVEPVRLHYKCDPAHGHAWSGPLCCGNFPESRVASAGAFVQPARLPIAGAEFPSHAWIEVLRVDLEHPLEQENQQLL